MKIRPLFIIFSLSIFCLTVSAQSVVITGKKVTYKRPKPLVDFKRTFSVIYPTIKGKLDPRVRKEITATIDYWRVFETSLREEIESSWLDNCFYKINYNRNYLLDISLTMEGAGAYPDSATRNIVIDLKTGKQIKFKEAFNLDSLDTFSALVNRKLQSEIKRIIKGIDNETENQEENGFVKVKLSELKFAASDFNEFSVSDKGVVILYDAEFAHAIEGLQPEGRYFFTWPRLKPYINRNGLLARFIR